ncbi:MAG TPA: ABC transporter ATP-binding protein [Candidatus Dormibacteraeota bacterium]|nr:ABC transporter ATP-binding protein [Candidatus Dormibacteraeota bacterium]
MSEIAVALEGVGKRYKIFSGRSDHVLDALGIPRLLPWVKPRYRDFWALRAIDLTLDRGDRIGIIGRNGAGKTTMLKLITGNLAPTEGRVDVRGDVQALLDVGGGFHPEFTGRENVRAALTYQGMSKRDIRSAEVDILEFTELGEFFDQPFRTYSLGMQARLTFACATAITPDVLIVDEILGAGDAAFYRRSTDRMRSLMHEGATVLLVSHALQQIQRFCERCIWIESGEIVMRGATTEVVKAYEKFTREFDRTWLREQRERSTGDAVDTGLSEWTDVPGLRIDSVSVENGEGREQSVFEVGEGFRVRMRVRAEQAGNFSVVPVSLIFRPDGLVVTRHIGRQEMIDAAAGDEFTATLDLDNLQLGNGDYLLSVGVWANVDPTHIEPSSYYHNLDRSFRFRVIGNPPMHNEMFVHPGSWRLGPVESRRAARTGAQRSQ